MAVSEWLDMMADTVTVYPLTGRASDGKPTYSATGVSYPAYVNMKNHLVVDRQGRTVTARGYAILGTTTVIGIEDKVVLPAEYTPTTPPLIDVNVQTDKSGNHHVKLVF